MSKLLISKIMERHRPSLSLTWDEMMRLYGDGGTTFYVASPTFYGKTIIRFTFTGAVRYTDNNGIFFQTTEVRNVCGETINYTDFCSATDRNLTVINGYNDYFVFERHDWALAYAANTSFMDLLNKVKIFIGQNRKLSDDELWFKLCQEFNVSHTGDVVTTDPFHYEPKRVIML